MYEELSFFSIFVAIQREGRRARRGRGGEDRTEECQTVGGSVCLSLCRSVTDWHSPSSPLHQSVMERGKNNICAIICN